MSDAQSRERLYELLADAAVGELSDEARVELDALAIEFPEVDAESFERAAAAVDLALAPGEIEPLPDALRATVEEQALRALREDAPRVTPPRGARRPPPARASRRGGPSSLVGWVAAAAFAALAVLSWWPTPTVPTPGAAELRRAALLATAADAQTLEWTATGDPAGPEASGDVVWSDSEARGYMRFRGLAVNDPTESQYQLWIFDAARDEARPVDGGVFDIDSATGEVVVPIDAKLPVSRATLFAITIERPGGVVVSSRERLPLLAKVAETS